MVKTHFLLENLSISEPSLGILQNFQCRSALPNIKYNCVVLFLKQVNYLFNYAPKTKNSTEKKISHRLQCQNFEMYFLTLSHFEVFSELYSG